MSNTPVTLQCTVRHVPAQRINGKVLTNTGPAHRIDDEAQLTPNA